MGVPRTAQESDAAAQRNRPGAGLPACRLSSSNNAQRMVTASRVLLCYSQPPSVHVRGGWAMYVRGSTIPLSGSMVSQEGYLGGTIVSRTTENREAGQEP